MVGFLAIASLTGIAAAAWPIYLHLRRERRVRLQEVPSLRIFRWRTRPARRKKFEDLLLLAARVGTVTALALLAAQPFLSAARKLPLPSLGGAEDENRLLGLVIDDSLSSFHGATEAARFENARAWLLGQLELLPESVDVSVATTTYPRPTPPLARDDATSLLAKMRPVMKEGNANEALSRMAELVRGRGGALVVAASREEGLWPAAVGGKPPGTIRQAWFLDTTGWRTDAFIRRVARPAAPAGSGALTCEVSGEQSSLAEKVLSVRNRKGKEILRRPLTLHESLRGAVALEDLEAAALEEEALEFSIGDGVSTPVHPWSRYYAAIGKRAAPASRLVIFHEEAPEAVASARVLGATARALRPALPVTFATLPGDPAGWPAEASLAIFISSGGLPPEAAAWLERQIGEGLQVLCVPAGSRPGFDISVEPGGAPAPASLRLPAWGPPSEADQPGLAPFRLSRSGAPELGRFDELLLRELGELEAPLYREPIFAGGQIPVISTSAGKAFLSLARQNERSAVWALGVPINLDRGGLAYHPVFPLLFEWILFPSLSRRDDGPGGGAALVGESRDARAWFGAAGGERLVLPSGATLPLGGGAGASGWIPITEAGIYELHSETGSRLRAANHPRPPEGALLDRRRLAEAAGVEEAVWLSAEEGFSLEEELERSRLGPEGGTRRYDLSGIMAFLLIACLAAELIFLVACWRRAGLLAAGVGLRVRALFLLRTAALTALTLLFWRVFFAREEQSLAASPQTREPEVVVLEDRSGSMDLPGAPGQARRDLAESVWAQVRERAGGTAGAFSVKRFLFAENLVEEGDGGPLLRDGSRLSRALTDVLSRRDLRSLLIVSDGAATDGLAPPFLLDWACNRNIRVNAVLSARENLEIRDRAVLAVDCQHQNPTSLGATVTCSGAESGMALITLSVDGERVATLERQAQPRMEVPFRLPQLENGWHEYAVEVAPGAAPSPLGPPEGKFEATLSNNVLRGVFRVERQTVVLVHGRPDAEPVHLARLLRRRLGEHLFYLGAPELEEADVRLRRPSLVILADVAPELIPSALRGSWAEARTPLLFMGGEALDRWVGLGIPGFPLAEARAATFLGEGGRQAAVEVEPAADDPDAPLGPVGLPLDLLREARLAETARVARGVKSDRGLLPVLVSDSPSAPRLAVLLTDSTWKWALHPDGRVRRGYELFWSAALEMLAGSREDGQLLGLEIEPAATPGEIRGWVKAAGLRKGSTISKCRIASAPSLGGRRPSAGDFRRVLDLGEAVEADRVHFRLEGEQLPAEGGVLWLQAAGEIDGSAAGSDPVPVAIPAGSRELADVLPHPEVLRRHTTGEEDGFSWCPPREEVIDSLFREESPRWRVSKIRKRNPALEFLLAAVIITCLALEWRLERKLHARSAS